MATAPALPREPKPPEPPRRRPAPTSWKDHRFTLMEFLALPERKPALEFEEGRVTQKVSPKAQHSALQSELAERFNRAARRRKIARAFPELRFTVVNRSYVPDVSVFRWDRIQRRPDGKLENDVTTAPDIVVEVVSPRQGVNTLVRRCLAYVGLGVQAALLVDPGDESVVLFRQGEAPVALRGAESIDLADLLPGFRLTVADLFKALYVD